MCCQRLYLLCQALSGSIHELVGDIWTRRWHCTKPFNKSWSLEYKTSGVAGAGNSRFKTQMSPRSQSVMDVRQLALDLEEQSRINREQMKGGRHYKIKDRAANGITSNLPVHLRIDEGLGDSCKTELVVPIAHPFFGARAERIIEVIEKDIFGSDILFQAKRSVARIPCLDAAMVERCGLPCSHPARSGPGTKRRNCEHSFQHCPKQTERAGVASVKCTGIGVASVKCTGIGVGNVNRNFRQVPPINLIPFCTESGVRLRFPLPSWLRS
jgi:hypothetical protein